MLFNDMANAALGLCTKALGESVTYTPLSGAPVTINAIFENKYYEVNSANGVPVLTKKPTIGIRLSDIASEPAVGDAVTVRSVNYKVQDVDDDGNGGTTLVLRLA